MANCDVAAKWNNFRTIAARWTKESRNIKLKSIRSMSEEITNYFQGSFKSNVMEYSIMTRSDALLAIQKVDFTGTNSATYRIKIEAIIAYKQLVRGFREVLGADWEIVEKDEVVKEVEVRTLAHLDCLKDMLLYMTAPNQKSDIDFRKIENILQRRIAVKLSTALECFSETGLWPEELVPTTSDQNSLTVFILMWMIVYELSLENLLGVIRSCVEKAGEEEVARLVAAMQIAADGKWSGGRIPQTENVCIDYVMMICHATFLLNESFSSKLLRLLYVLCKTSDRQKTIKAMADAKMNNLISRLYHFSNGRSENPSRMSIKRLKMGGAIFASTPGSIGPMVLAFADHIGESLIYISEIWSLVSKKDGDKPKYEITELLRFLLMEKTGIHEWTDDLNRIGLKVHITALF